MSLIRRAIASRMSGSCRMLFGGNDFFENLKEVSVDASIAP
jgi:hypothetical protein